MQLGSLRRFVTPASNYFVIAVLSVRKMNRIKGKRKGNWKEEKWKQIPDDSKKWASRPRYIDEYVFFWRMENESNRIGNKVGEKYMLRPDVLTSIAPNSLLHCVL